ncbi:hypothetical protein CR513_24273, partial [Mucuna pruriens]
MDPTDMPSIDPDFLCHRLSISLGARPVSQKKRRLGEEKKRAIRAEMAKLLQARFIQEVKYPSWLSNVVMVKKSSGKWRMCTDYTDLACPKDLYLLPNIDALVDGASSCRLLNFMDTYSGYNQIRMHPSDESKTAFITNEGNFCYRVMPFGLKNARATYQRLMDQILKDHVRNQLEVYVEDTMVKSKMEIGHDENLASIFKVLRKYQLRLNPEKCSFGVKAEKFFGFMLTRRGIEANPEKCNTIIDMRSPKSVKEVHQLTERVIALARFLSQSTEKSTPIFQRLRKIECFRWTNECEAAFQELKMMLSSPLILTWSILVTSVIIQKEEDGSSNKKGNGVRIILEGPSGVLIEQSLCFGFRASNNQAEYEASLVRVRLAKELGAKRLTIKTNSQLITGQVNGEYQAKDLQLTRYLGMVKAQTETFEGFTLLHVPQEQNERADLLVKLASTQKGGLHRTIIQKALGRPTIEGTGVLCTEWRLS